MDQPFNPFFQLSKATVVGQVCNLSNRSCAFWITPRNRNPRIFAQLLKTQGNAVTLAIKLEYLHINFIANGHDFARMLDALPGHVGDVQ